MWKLRIWSILVLGGCVTLGSIFVQKDSPFIYIIIVAAIFYIIFIGITKIKNNYENTYNRIFIKTLTEQLSRTTKSYNPHYEMVLNLLKGGHRKRAIKELGDLLNSGPKDPNYYALYATLLMWDITWPFYLGEKTKQYKLKELLSTCQDNFKKALQLDSKHFTANVSYAVLLSELRSFKKSFQYFKIALRSYPNLPVCRLQYAIANIRNNNFKKAKLLLEEERTLFGLYPELAFAYGQYNLAVGKLILAQLSFNQALKKIPMFAEAHQRYSEVIDLRGEVHLGYLSKIKLLIIFSKAIYLESFLLGLIELFFKAIIHTPLYVFHKLLRKIKLLPVSVRQYPQMLAMLLSIPYVAATINLMRVHMYSEALGACRKALLINPYHKESYIRIMILYAWKECPLGSVYWSRRFS